VPSPNHPKKRLANLILKYAVNFIRGHGKGALGVFEHTSFEKIREALHGAEGVVPNVIGLYRSSQFLRDAVGKIEKQSP
jgi:hypothetical protein